jgi:hypothetical protein
MPDYLTHYCPSSMNDIPSDDEEDFLALVGQDLQGAPTGTHVDVIINNTPPPEKDEPYLSAREPASPVDVKTSPPVEPVHHVLHSDSEPDTPRNPEFGSVLSEFYSKHNFANLDKVPYLADKFVARKWDLWEQLCIKYRLSPKESTKLWSDFQLCSESNSRLFQLSDSIAPSMDRSTLWLELLGQVTAAQVREYDELREMCAYSDKEERGYVSRDVTRTHQDFEFFQQVCNTARYSSFIRA